MHPQTPVAVTKDLIAQHGLTEEEHQKIVSLLGREPNLTELGMFSVMWSEHCSYKSSRAFLKKLPTEGPHVIQGPGENAGAVDIGAGLAAVFKMESHNHPSFIEPYQGAATGVGGILRDIFTMGARPIALLDSLRFGPLDRPKNRFLFSGVVSGIAGYGNCTGVPTVGGEVYFNEIYNHNPLVNVFCLGIARKDRIFRGQASGVGNPVLYIGAKTGRDGIHGATMASDSFDEGSESMRPTVQVGDPFTEKLLLEACLEVMEQDLLVGIQDMGAAGLTSSSCEMASRAGTGIELELANVPRRESGMTPYEVLLSESQERMLLIAKPGREGEVLDICKKWDVDAAVIGRVTNDGVLRVKEKGVVVAEVPTRALTDNAPTYERPAAAPAYQDALQSLPLELIPEPKDCNAVLEALLTSPTIAHKGWVFEQYDHMVQTNTVIRPGSDAAVLRIKGTNKALAVTADCNSLYCVLNPYTGAASAVAEAARNLVCAGARPLALTDCLNFGNPERPDIMWQFILAVEGIADACKALQIPVVSGNVSFYNETRGLSIYPTPIIGMVGLLDHVERVVSQGFTAEGDAVLLLGETGEDLGGTEYLRTVHHREQGTPPVLNLEREVALQRVVLQAVEQGLVRSAHDCAEGGLAVALAESCLSATNGPLGAEIVLDRHGLRRDSLLFGESQSRIILSAKPANRETIETLARQADVPCSVLGFVRGRRLMISIRDDRGRTALSIDRPCEKLDTMWRGALRAALDTGEGGHA
jgi:phosphoribosylformylglycinamidine synthase II